MSFPTPHFVGHCNNLDYCIWCDRPYLVMGTFSFLARDRFDVLSVALLWLPEACLPSITITTFHHNATIFFFFLHSFSAFIIAYYVSELSTFETRLLTATWVFRRRTLSAIVIIWSIVFDAIDHILWWAHPPHSPPNFSVFYNVAAFPSNKW